MGALVLRGKLTFIDEYDHQLILLITPENEHLDLRDALDEFDDKEVVLVVAEQS